MGMRGQSVMWAGCTYAAVPTRACQLQQQRGSMHSEASSSGKTEAATAPATEEGVAPRELFGQVS